MKTASLARRSRTRTLTLAALLAALLCVISPLALPLPGAVPLSLTTFFLYLGAAILPAGPALAAVAVYLLLGCLGLPVFSGGAGGVACLAGPTGGFLLGYLPLVATIGLLLPRLHPERSRRRALLAYPLAMAAGTALLYALGCAVYILSCDLPLRAALAATVLPFLPGDALKIALATALLTARKQR